MSTGRVVHYPPMGVPFRLLASENGMVFFSTAPGGRWVDLTRIEGSSIPPNQVYNIVLGSGRYANLIAFRNTHTNRFLMSTEAGVGQVVTLWDLSDIDISVNPEILWQFVFFRLDLVGRGPNIFHLVSQNPWFSHTQVLPFEPASRTSNGENLERANHGLDIHANLLLSFRLEDMAFSRIDYLVDEGNIFDPPAQVQMGLTQTIENDTDVQQTTEFIFTHSTVTTSTFTHTHGFELTIGMEVRARIPFIGSGRISAEGSTTHTWEWGSDISEERSYQSRVLVHAPPRSRVVGTAFINRSRIDVPYTLIIRSVSGRVEEHSHGIFRGVDYWDIRARYVQYPLPSSGRKPGIEVLVPPSDIKTIEVRRPMVIKTDQERPPLYFETVVLETEKRKQLLVDVETN